MRDSYIEWDQLRHGMKIARLSLGKGAGIVPRGQLISAYEFKLILHILRTMINVEDQVEYVNQVEFFSQRRFTSCCSLFLRKSCS